MSKGTHYHGWCYINSLYGLLNIRLEISEMLVKPWTIRCACLASWECLGIHEFYPTKSSELEKTHRPGACAKHKSESKATGGKWFPKNKEML